MKREKDKLLKISSKKSININVKNQSRIAISIFLSFSLHILLIFLISILAQNPIKVENINKVNVKSIEIQLESDLIAFKPLNKSNINLKSSGIFKEEDNKKENKIESNDLKDYQVSDDGEDLKMSSTSTSNLSSDTSLNTSLEESDNSNDQYSQSLTTFIGENIGSNNDSQFLNENVLQYSVNSSSLFKYPKDALRLGIQGTVKLKLHIDKHGKVIDLILLESSGSKILDNYTIKQARQLLFSFPENKKPDSSFWVVIKVVYSIKSNVIVEVGS